MVFDALDSHRLKCPVPNVEGDLGDFDPDTSQTIQQLRCEVKTCGWSRDRASLVGKDGLIPFGIQTIFVIAFDVGWKRGAPDSIDDLVKVTQSLEADNSSASFAPLNDLGSQLSTRKFHSRAWGQSSSRLYQRLPDKWFDAADKKDLHAPAEYRFTSWSDPKTPAY